MNTQDIGLQVFQLQVEAEGIASIVSAIHQAMESGGYSLDTYTPAVWSIGGMIEEHAKKLEALTDTIRPRKGQEGGGNGK